MDEFGEYVDWYDYSAVEKFNEKRSKQWIRLFQMRRDALEKGDEKALEKGRETIRKHEKQDKIYKEKAKESGYWWT